MFWALAQIGEDIARWRREGYEEGFKEGYERGLKLGREEAREELRERLRDKYRMEFLRELVERNIALPREILDEVNGDGGYLPRSWLF